MHTMIDTGDYRDIVKMIYSYLRVVFQNLLVDRPRMTHPCGQLDVIFVHAPCMWVDENSGAR